MSRSLLLILVLLFCLQLWNCTGDSKVNREAVKEEIKQRQIIKVSEAEIINKVHELGNSIALSTKQTLGKNLQSALQNGGVENAISYCNLKAMPLVDSLSKEYDAVIRRVSFKVRNPQDKPSELEQTLLEAYDYQWQDSIPLQTNVQQINDEAYLFAKPILVDNALCLTCHGKTENGLLKETDDFIKSKYPADSATGYEIGDLRGMWSITISKKAVIQSM